MRGSRFPAFLMLRTPPLAFFFLCLPLAAAAQGASFVLGLWALPTSWATSIAESAEVLGRAVAAPDLTLLIWALALGPVVEEILFRWILINALRTKLDLSAWWAVFLSALAFALAHVPFNPTAAALAFALGYLFGWVYVRTDSLAYPIAAHIATNAAGCAIAAAAYMSGYLDAVVSS